MELLYVDESGDPGRQRGGKGNNSAHYILSGITLYISQWQMVGGSMKSFRRYLRDHYRLPLHVELHAAELIRISQAKEYKELKKRDRIRLLGDFVRSFPGCFPEQTRILNVCLRKSDFPKVDNFQELAWRRLIRGFEKHLISRNRMGMIMADHNSDPTIGRVLREMRTNYPLEAPYYHEAGRRYPRVWRVVEDIVFRDSKSSGFIQAADAIAHCLYRKEFPKASLKKYNVDRFFDYLEPFLYLDMNPDDPHGIVRS